jgi:MFS transporter, NNP family, nitrate/nitrite transporter
MSTTLDATPTPPATRRTGRWIDDWDPDNEEFWASTGRRVARKNLFFSIFAEHFGFAIWVLWSVVVINLANAGIPMTLAEMFWLTAVPNLVGSTLRIPYTFAVPRFGGRLWTGISAALLLIPALLLAFLVPSGWLAAQSHDTQFWVLLACAATAGFGGGNFSSSMANISFFYPEKRKGFALGLNAAGGNLGVAVVQLVVPLVVIIGVPMAAAKLPKHEVHLAYAGLVWIPFIVTAAVCAWLFMDSITDARADTRSYVSALRHGQTWIMSILYIGTFGSFIGYSFAFGLVLQNQFGRTPLQAAAVTFIGPLLGSLIRPVGGWLADRYGGAKVTFYDFVAMGLSTAVVIAASAIDSLALFTAGFVLLFVFSGVGNGSTYKMIPAIFAAKAKLAVEAGADADAMAAKARRLSRALIGIAGAVGAFGGVLVNIALRQSFLSSGTGDGAYMAFIAFYVACLVVTWVVYMRPAKAKLQGV